ncbi:9214_t:CDS:2 [Funneliformis mosseae]|uniref:9214_t:CDS:1 n=1 Tax=Funneliformis mosseae TaxID=27381 RepID=A0A9N9GIG7_FUNMO|nr:9214_t:CDS:2 [Funneliformis mosseae]
MGVANGKYDVDFTEEVNLSHFKLLRVVGRGAFGKVRIVERRDNKRLFALKYISKEECIKMEALRNIFRERSMLEELDHPLVCNLRFAFQDDEYMYMVMDLMMGGDLRFHLNRKTFTEDAIRFWIAELACAIRYLHSKGVVHRDIKPDNVLLDDHGHAHLTDFNIATHIRPDKLLTSHSGTCAYMAPEVFRGGGYGITVDWWSLGVMLYECIYGKRPFDCDNQEELKKMIVKAPIKYLDMDPPVSPACVSAIQGFLERDTSRRLGCGPNGFALIQSHPFFRNIDWPLLENKRINPIFKPSSDRINFDATYDLEELLLEEQPLEARHNRRRRRRKDGEGSEKEAHYQLIEEKFKTFDYTVFEKYEGWVDPVTKCVADPPEWVKPAAVEVLNQIERGSQDGIGANSGDLSNLAGISLDNGIKI